MNKFVIIIVLLLIVISNTANAQFAEEKPELKDRFFYGGGLGLTFGNITHIDLSPLVGFRVTERFSVGLGVSYQYYNNNAQNIKTSIYGGKIFTSFTIIKDLSNIIPFGNNLGGIMLHAEAEALNFERRVLYYTNDTTRIWVFSPLVGLGYQLPVGQRSYLNIYALYNFNEGKNSPYSNPVIRVSLQF